MTNDLEHLFICCLLSVCGKVYVQWYCSVFIIYLQLYLFREGKAGRKRGRETSMYGGLLHTTPPHPPMGTWPATQACALTGNWTGDLLLHSPALSPLNHTSQGSSWSFILTYFTFGFLIHFGLIFVNFKFFQWTPAPCTCCRRYDARRSVFLLHCQPLADLTQQHQRGCFSVFLPLSWWYTAVDYWF